MLISKRFYFLRAWYEWITDNRLTPYIIVDAQYQGVCVPDDYVENDRITLNLSPQAIIQLSLNHNRLTFEADFDEPVGTFSIVVPIQSVIAIYAQENKQGAFFLEEEESEVGGLKGNLQKSSPAFTVVEE